MNRPQPDDLELVPEEGVIMRRTVGAKLIDLVELTFSRWALKIGPAPSDGGYDAEYTYDHPRSSAMAQAAAIAAMLDWDGQAEPEGWVRALVAGRPTRRRPEADPAREFERE